MREIEVEGRNVTTAVETGLSDLGLRRDQVEVEVLQEAAPGFLGLGAKSARVRIREKIWDPTGQAQPSRPERQSAPRKREPSTPENSQPQPAQPPARSEAPPRRSGPRERRPYNPSVPSGSPSSSGRTSRGAEPTRRSLVHEPPPDTALACEESKKVLDEILKLLLLPEASVCASWDSAQVRVLCEVKTPENSALTDFGEHFLESLQFLATLITSRRLKHPVAVQVDSQGYWKEKEEDILLQVHQAMEMLKRTNHPVRLKPMDAVMRRLVHRTLAKHPEIETASEGEGSWRKVVLKPKKK
ncbi:MAG: Jag N-terminal domain-containing protein [Elusimicrobia bacterium]|nr:Jag N-terminal domain-containing protein [Elusimicrobiota bacterium]